MKKTGPLWKASAKAGQVLEYSVQKNKLLGWVAEQFRQRGTPTEHEACTALVAIVGEDLHALAAEVDKIATWAGGEPVGEREVLALAAPFGEEPMYKLTDALGARDGTAALSLSETIFDRDDRQRRDVSARMAGAISGHVSRLATLRRMSERGVSSKDAAAELKLHPFRAEKLARQAESFSPEELDDATIRLARLDHALKGGSRLSPDLELQLAVADLARERR